MNNEEVEQFPIINASHAKNCIFFFNNDHATLTAPINLGSQCGKEEAEEIIPLLPSLPPSPQLSRDSSSNSGTQSSPPASTSTCKDKRGTDCLVYIFN